MSFVPVRSVSTVNEQTNCPPASRVTFAPDPLYEPDKPGAPLPNFTVPSSLTSMFPNVPLSEVTVGLWRLQQVMHELGPLFQDTLDVCIQPRRAILVPVPGSQHTMGLFMVAEFFRRAGWDVWGDAMVSMRDIVAAAHDEWFDLVGLSVGSETQVDALASVILEVRKASRNRGLLVLIGGPIVASTPGLVSQVGADATAEDAPQAVRQAECLLAERSVAS